MKILLAEQDEATSELHSMEIEAKFNCEVIEKKDYLEIIESLKENNDIFLIIGECTLSSSNVGTLYSYVTKNHPQIPLIVLSSKTLAEIPGLEKFKLDNPQNTYLAKPFGVDELLDCVNDILSKDQPFAPKKYCRVRTFRFLRFNNLPCDIYIKLSDKKYVKIINKNELYDVNIIEKYINKNIGHLYVKNEDFINFTNNYTELITNSLNQHKDSDGHSTDAELSSVSILHEMISNLGITPKIVETINATIESNITQIKKNPNLFEILDSIMKQQSFLYEHGLLTSYICGTIAQKMSWEGESIIEKLTISSILHDVTLEKLKNLEINNELLEDLNSTQYHDLHWKQQKIIRDHPILSAELAKTIQNFPADVDKIIALHHEKPDGDGYPKGLTANRIPPVACLFIISETFARRIYDKEIEKNKIKLIIQEFKETFNKGNFKKPLEGFLETFSLLS